MKEYVRPMKYVFFSILGLFFVGCGVDTTGTYYPPVLQNPAGFQGCTFDSDCSYLSDVNCPVSYCSFGYCVGGC
jgi:hypothetical protein